MALPRRFYNVLVLSMIATLTAYLFLYRSSSPSYAYTAVDVSNGDPFDSNENSLKDVVPPADAPSSTHIPSEPPIDSPITAGPDGPKEEKEAQITQETVRIAVTESGGSHDEVTAAFVHAFGKQPGAEISTYLLLQRYGIADIIKNFNLSSPIAANKSSGAFGASVKDFPHPHILVAATCEIEIVKLSAAYETLLAGGKTFLFCVIHHADHWVEGELVDKIRPWVEKEMVQFVGLSAHTAQYLRTQCVAKWGSNATVLVDYLPPVFPVDMEENARIEAKAPLTFALQGDYDPSRRNYTSTFERLSNVVALAKKRLVSQNVTLRLIGHGSKPYVPETLRSHISFDQNLEYTSYYTLLSRTFTLLPSFASKDYYDRKASSTVPAALIAGAPLVANFELLDAYTYVPTSAVWKQEEDESEMDVVQRVVQLSDTEHDGKKKIVRETCQAVVKRNVELVAEWMTVGLAKIE
jgi:hypothetical protein